MEFVDILIGILNAIEAYWEKCKLLVELGQTLPFVLLKMDHFLTSYVLGGIAINLGWHGIQSKSPRSNAG